MRCIINGGISFLVFSLSLLLSAKANELCTSHQELSQCSNHELDNNAMAATHCPYVCAYSPATNRGYYNGRWVKDAPGCENFYRDLCCCERNKDGAKKK